MPRGTRKRSLLNPNKSQLVFVEQPRNGPRHDYGPKLRSAINPKSFISEHTRQGVTISSWVSPQFTSVEVTAAKRGGRGRKRNHLPTNSMSTASHLAVPQVRKATTSKYPTLQFEADTPVPQRCHKTLHNTRSVSCVTNAHDIRHPQSDDGKMDTPNNPSEMPTPRQMLSLSTRGQKTPALDSIDASRSSDNLKTPLASTIRKQRDPGSEEKTVSKRSYTPNTMFTPPHIETPDIPSVEVSHSSSICHLFFPPIQPKTPPRTQKAGLLVNDTPERDYGLKVTWRRRKHLMRLLTERGQLLICDTVISNWWT